MQDDRDNTEGLKKLMDEFMTDGSLGDLAAEELAAALKAHGIFVHPVFADEDGVNVALGGLRDAETLLALTIAEDGPGTLYDRATSSCVTLTKLSKDADATGVEPHEWEVAAAFRAGWKWLIHPEMSGRVVGWHITVCIPPDDAMALASRLNEIRNGGAV